MTPKCILWQSMKNKMTMVKTNWYSEEEIQFYLDAEHSGAVGRVLDCGSNGY